MDIIPTKFRSPPPKPPRRRHSDQLTISPSGTYPSSRKKCLDENKMCLKGNQSNCENDKRCGSLPASWIDDFSLDSNIENSMLLRNATYSPSAHQRNACENFQIPAGSSVDKCSNGLIERTMETNFKKSENFEWTRNSSNPYIEQVIKSRVFSSKCYLKKWHKCADADIQNGSNSFDVPIDNKNKFDSKQFPKEYHRRHHSDPVLSFLDRSNSKIALKKYALRSHSFLESTVYDNNNRLCNSLSTSFKSKESLYLHEEMKNLKDINNKLWQHLCSTQACFEKFKKNSEESPSAFSISDLLSSLYCSQRAKDSAMEDRMKVIIEERDIAIQELEDMVQVIARSFEDDTILEEEKYSDKEIKELLKEIEVTSNPAKLLQQQRLLLTYLYRTKELKQDRIRHELKFALNERDHLMEKVTFLEEELKNRKLCSDIWNSDNKHWENNLLKILCQVIQQRDMALSKVNISRSLDHINYRLIHENARAMESLTKDYEPLQRHADLKISAVKRNSPKNVHNCEPFTLESKSDEIRLLKGEIMVLSKALEMEVEKKESAEEKCLRLERLVNVLQKKVNGQNVGISV